MIIKIDDSVLSYDDISLYEFLRVIVDLSRFHKDSFFISSKTLIHAIKRIGQYAQYLELTKTLKQLDSSYSTIMSIHSNNNDNFLSILKEDDDLKITLYIDREVHFSYFADIKEVAEKIINTQIYFENQSDADFIESVIKSKINSNTLLEDIKQPCGGNTIVDKFKQGLTENKLWFFVIDEDICIDDVRIKDSISKKCEDLAKDYKALSYHTSTVSRSIENLIPIEIINEYLSDFCPNKERTLFDKMLVETNYFQGYNVKEGIRKDVKKSCRKLLRLKWNSLTGVSCDELSEKCINRNMCISYDLTDVIYSGVTVGKHPVLEYATVKINEGFPFLLKDNLEKLVRKVYDLSSLNRDLHNLVWGI